jgi:AcrR family transcriptional regulator
MARTEAPEIQPRTQMGRPRDETRDHAVFAAVREILAEEGYEALSVNKVTQRCGVHVRTISRRWGSKAEMVAAAVLWADTPMFSQAPHKFPSGNLRADLREMIAGNIAFLSEPATRAAIPALQRYYVIDEKVAQYFSQREHGFELALKAILRAAVDSGDVPKGALKKEQILARVIGGTSFDIAFGPHPKVTNKQLDDLVAFVVAGINGTA